MLSIKEYQTPDSVEEAFAFMETAGKRAALIAGGAFLNLGKKRIGTAIDLRRAGLDNLKQDDQALEIGAMVTLGAFDRTPELDPFITGFLRKAYRDVVGVQLRNMATYGGTVHARYGFSDILTALITLDAVVSFHRAGEIPLADYLAQGIAGPDILTEIRIERTLDRWGYQALRKSTADFPLLTAAVSRCGGQWRAAVGARPGRALLAHGLIAALNTEKMEVEDTERLGSLLTEELPFGGNSRATAEYRRQVCGVLVSDALKEAGYDAD